MFNKKRIAPLLCALLILLTLVMPAIPAQAAVTAIIEAGTYRFHDILDFSSLEPDVWQEFSLDFIVPDLQFAVTQEQINYVLSQEGVLDAYPDLVNLEPCEFTVDLSFTGVSFYYSGYFSDYHDPYGLLSFLGMDYVVEPENFTSLFYCEIYLSGNEVFHSYYPPFDPLYQTIVVTKDQEVSAEFAEWFTAYTVSVGSSSGSNTPGLSPGGSDGFVAVLDVFDSVGSWLSGAVNETTSIFYADGQMTFIGEVAIACVCISFALLVLFLISKWLRFK